MTLVNAETGEIVAHCTPDEARELTDQIRDFSEHLWSLLLTAHDRRAWAALGYPTWADYVQSEFDMSRSRSYQMLDQGRVIRAIEEVVSTFVDTEAAPVVVTEGAAREIKPRLKAVTNAIKERLTEEADAPEPERVEAIVAEVVAAAREKAKQDDEDRRALNDLSQKAANAGLDMDKDSLAERGKWSQNCRELAAAGDPTEFVAKHRKHFTDRHVAQAERAYAWLDEFLLEMREDG